MAWLRTPSPLLALLPAFALLGACDTEDEDTTDGMSDLEDEDLVEDAEDEDADDQDAEDADDDEDPAGEDEDTDEDAEQEDEDEDTRSGVRFEPCDWETMEDGVACEMEDGQAGRQECILVAGEEVLTPCSLEEPACNAGDTWDDVCSGNDCLWDAEAEEFYEESWSDDDDCNTPLVVNFDGGPIEYGPVAAATFDLSTNGSCTNTAWPTSPWLALDRDGDGMIRSGAELFGNATAMASGDQASNGFAALAELDTNLDGRISAKDERFSELVLWNDWDADRLGAYGELQPLSETSLVSIDLGYSKRAECDGNGNCGIERASFEYRKGNATAFGEVVDVHLLCQ